MIKHKHCQCVCAVCTKWGWQMIGVKESVHVCVKTYRGRSLDAKWLCDGEKRKRRIALIDERHWQCVRVCAMQLDGTFATLPSTHSSSMNAGYSVATDLMRR